MFAQYNKNNKLESYRRIKIIEVIVLLAVILNILSMMPIVRAWSNNTFTNMLLSENLSFHVQNYSILYLQWGLNDNLSTTNVSGNVPFYKSGTSNGNTNTYHTVGNIGSGAFHFAGNSSSYVISNFLTDICGKEPRTLMAWVKPENQVADRHFMGYGTVPISGSMFGLTLLSTDNLYFYGQGDDVDSGTKVNPNVWSHVAVTYNGSQIRMFVNGSETATSNVSKPSLSTTCGQYFYIGKDISTGPYYHGDIDDVRIYNGTLSPNEIKYIYDKKDEEMISKSRTLDVPQYVVINEGYINISSLDNATSNVSIYIDNVSVFNSPNNYTGVNKTSNLASVINSYLGTCNYISGYCSVPFSFFSYTSGNISYSNMIFNNVGYTENSQTYNSEAYSGSLEKFIINISYDSTEYTSATAFINYNGSIYSSTSTVSGGGSMFINATFTASFNVPNQEANYSFYWIINLTNSTGINTFNSKWNNQTVTNIFLRHCNNLYNITYINFTIYNQEEKTQEINTSSFKATFYYGLSLENNSYSYYSSNNTNSSFAFCSNKHLNITADAMIEYEATGYAKNYYYLDSVILTNITTEIKLYLLNSSKTTLTVLKAYDLSKKPLTNVIIQIQSYDVGTDTYTTTSMARTDYNGEDIAYLNWYNTFYKFILIQNGDIIFVTNSSKISETPKVFQVESESFFPYDKFDNVVYSLTFNNATNNFVLTFADPSGLITSNCLRVIKRTIKNDTLICNTCESSSSATIYCNIAAYGNGTFIGTYYGLGSHSMIGTITAYINVANDIYNLIGIEDATFYAIIFSGIVLSIFLISPVFAILGALIGLLGSTAMGFYILGSPFINAIIKNTITAVIAIVTNVLNIKGITSRGSDITS